jgi:[acyl-carrier-protein] S-malonyltransferase
MREELKKYIFRDPIYPVISNYDAQVVVTGNDVASKLAQQINHPVLWESTIRRMADQGFEHFIEIGPQRILSGLLRRIDKTKKSSNIEDIKSLEKTIESLKH